MRQAFMIAEQWRTLNLKSAGSCLAAALSALGPQREVRHPETSWRNANEPATGRERDRTSGHYLHRPPRRKASRSAGRPSRAISARVRRAFWGRLPGQSEPHSLLPRGWQRSGGLVALFAPSLGPPQAGLQTPATLLSPSYGSQDKTTGHRTYQTIEGLSDRLGIPIASAYAEGQEPQLAADVVSTYAGVVLICWEHDHIPSIALSLPAVPGTAIPQAWPSDRFDVIWAFTLVPGAAPQYAFTQVPQQLLSGDADTIIQV